MSYKARSINARKRYRGLTAGLVMVLSAAFCGQAFAAEVFLDRPVRAGDLTVFQSAYEENSYYYLADKPVLDVNDSGTPKFSFMQYVRGQNDDQITGGGLVHAVVKLEVTDEQISEAERELKQRRGSSATIVGPIPFRGGKVALISATIDSSGDSEDRVVGLGSAPTLENQAIAVAASIPKEGAEILYASMQTPAPDFSISFEMTIDGYNSPIQASIVAEWDKIYSHKDIQAAVQSPLLAAELRATFENLRKTQVIKINSLAPDADMERAIEMAYSLILKEAFSPIQANSPTDMLPKAGGGQDSMLDRAGKMITAARDEASKKRKQCMADSAPPAAEPSGAAETVKAAVAATETPQAEKPTRVKADPEKDYNIQIGEKVYSYGRSSAEVYEKMTLHEDDMDVEDLPPGYVLLDEAAKIKEFVDQFRDDEDELSNDEEKQAAHSVAKEKSASDGGTLSNPPPVSAEERQKTCDAQTRMPVMAKAISYRLKKVRHSGRFEMDLSKATAASLPANFVLNMSGINRCGPCISQVNVDSPLNEPKDIQVSLGGEVGIESFDSYLNGAEVRIKKTHQDGYVTNQSAVFSRASFSESGNLIPIRYLWRNDNDRSKWPQYEYKVTWNLFGGKQEDTDWLESETDQIIVTPPIKAMLVDIDIPPSIATQNGILAVTLNTESSVGHRNSTTLNVFRNEMSKQHTVLVSRDDPSYQYTMSWQTETGDQEFGAVETSSQVILVRPR